MILVGKLILLPLFGFSQENLIINGNCEEYTICPDGNNNIVDGIGWWSFDSIGSPDYFNTCSTDPSTEVPNFMIGYQFPRSGNGMLHSINFAVKLPRNFYIENFASQFREAFGGSFSTPLQAGIYEFSMYVNYANFGFGTYPNGSDGRVATNAFDILLLTDSIKVPLATYPYIDPSQTFPLNGETIINDTLNWLKLSGCVLAKGGERFFVMGSLRDTAQIKLEFSGYNQYNFISSYYFDDFSLRACPTCCAGQFEIDEYVTVNYTEIGVQLVPFVLAGSTGSVRLYDSAGRWVASHTFESDSPPFVLPNLAQGMYHYFFETQSGTQKMGKVMSF